MQSESYRMIWSDVQLNLGEVLLDILQRLLRHDGDETAAFTAELRVFLFLLRHYGLFHEVWQTRLEI